MGDPGISVTNETANPSSNDSSGSGTDNTALYGNLIGGATGIVEFLLGLSQGNKAKGMFPSAISPEMEEAKSDFNRKRHNVFVGSAYNQQMNEIKGMMAGGTAAMARTGSTSNMNYYMRNVAKLTNQMLAQGQAAEAAADTNYIDLLKTGDASKRALDLMKYSQENAKSSSNQQSGFSNIMPAITDLLGMLGDGSTPGDPSGFDSSGGGMVGDMG